MNRIAAAILLALAGAGACAQDPAVSASPPSTTSPATSAVTSAAAAQVPHLKEDVERVMRLFDVPGIAIAIVKDGQVLAAEGFGVRKLGAPDKVDGRTLFEVASNSKAFTAAALAMLVDEGKLAWDDPVTRHLPDFQMADPYVTHEMTVRDLLTHRSGLGLGAGDLLWWPTTTFTSDEIIHKLRYIPLSTSFRSSYAYDNLLYIVAGKIVAAKSGKTWGETIRERILVPVGMTSTTTSLADNAGNPDVANPHSRIGGPEGRTVAVKSLPVPNAVGAVGINTNADDIARWMNVLLAGGRLPGSGTEKRLFSAKQSREMWTAQTPMRIAEPNPKLAAIRPNFLAYGLGFQLRDFRGRMLATHGGALQGFYSQVVMVPEAKLGIAILTNAESGGALSALQYQLLDRMLGTMPMTDWIAAVKAVDDERHAKEAARLAQTGAARAAKSLPSLPLSAYDGEYRDPWYGTAAIRHVGGKQILSFSRTPDLTGELEHFQHDTFIVRWKERNFNADAYVTFALNPDGSIERMKMQPVSTETDFSYDFQDLNFTRVKAAGRD
jgi:CubicO group peptidase (beta-lactamase class C family)